MRRRPDEGLGARQILVLSRTLGLTSVPVEEGEALEVAAPPSPEAARRLLVAVICLACAGPVQAADRSLVKGPAQVRRKLRICLFVFFSVSGFS